MAQFASKCLNLRNLADCLKDYNSSLDREREKENNYTAVGKITPGCEGESMSEKRPSRTTPALALLCVACLLPLLLPATAHATNRTIYVMGYGGITPTSVCPICSTVVCAVITNDGLEPLHWETTGGGSQYDIELNTGVPEPLTAIQGSDLDVKSVTPK